MPRTPTPEARFILDCVREPDGTAPQALRAAAVAVRDWNQVVQLAADHRVAAFVQQATLRAGLDLPPRSQTVLASVVRQALVQVLQLDADLERVRQAVVAAALPVLLLKGPVLAHTLYPQPAFRPYGDLDLTVPAAQEGTALAVLAECGFREVPHPPEVARRARAAHIAGGAAYHRTLVAGGGATVIELHLDPLQLGVQAADEAGRWQRALAVPHQPGLWMLSPADQLVALSVHAHRHGFARLIWLKDLDLLLRAARDPLDWPLVAAVARREGVRASVWYALWLAHRLLGTPVPQRPLGRLAPPLPVRLLYRGIWPAGPIADLRGKMRSRAVQFHAADSWRGMLPSVILLEQRRRRLRAVLSAVGRR